MVLVRRVWWMFWMDLRSLGFIKRGVERISLGFFDAPGPLRPQRLQQGRAPAAGLSCRGDSLTAVYV